MIRRLAVVSAALLAAATPAAAHTNTDAALLPSSVGYQPKDALEKGLWLEMNEQERLMRGSKFLIIEPGINAYLRSVLCRAVGKDKCGSVRIYLLRTPQFNAAMAPNGMLIVWSGLLLRVRNEAELATVLAHEFAHFEKQHSLQSFRDIRAKTDAMTWLGFVPGGTLAQIGLIGSVFRFNREMEKQADMAALDYLGASGYDAMAAAQIWEQLRGESEAAAKPSKPGAVKEEDNDFFSSHPNTKERMEYLQAAAAKKPPNGESGAERFHNVISPWWPSLIEDQVKLSEFAATEYLLGSLARDGWTAGLLYARGELYRARGKKGDFESAESYYRAAIGKDEALSESWRGLGLALLRQGKAEEGRKALRKYLANTPGAGDRAMIGMMAQEPSK